MFSVHCASAFRITFADCFAEVWNLPINLAHESLLILTFPFHSFYKLFPSCRVFFAAARTCCNGIPVASLSVNVVLSRSENRGREEKLRRTRLTLYTYEAWDRELSSRTSFLRFEPLWLARRICIRYLPRRFVKMRA